VLQALSGATADRRAPGAVLPDAVVIIRGGGAVNDLAWLNDYELARYVCKLEVPVLTGIGHERDSTVLDEVANMRFDTPSKVIAGIEQVIARRAAEARGNFEGIVRTASRATLASRRAAEQAEAAVRNSAQRQVAMARASTTALMSAVRIGALRSVQDASQATRDLYLEARHQAAGQITAARQVTPALLAEIRSGARHSLSSARSDALGQLGAVLERANLDARQQRQATRRALGDVATNARRLVADGAARSEALLREIAGQGPEKSLGRGFAIVRAAGTTVTSVREVPAAAPIEIEFRDGRLAARTEGKTGNELP
jgi:exodeoxyribonuclease VII large subunit